MLGGSFILLQYLSSRSLLTVEWNTISNVFEKGMKNRGGLRGISSWGIDFLTANIQGRGAFIGGLGLGMRLG